MSRIEAKFKAMGEGQRKGLIPFVTAGDPDLATTRKVLNELVTAGADLIELGMPYSDPMADGPVIQAASERAIAAGVNISGVLDLVRDFRKEHDTPIILFGYYNPIFQYGDAQFAEDAAAAGADGCLVVDLPPEEAGPFASQLQARGMDFIALLTPTSGPDRMEAVKRVASGFVYYVSIKGVTGAETKGIYDGLGSRINDLQGLLELPVAVGFGISTANDVQEVTRHADAAVVGSALIRAMAPDSPPFSEVPLRAGHFLKELSAGR